MSASAAVTLRRGRNQSGVPLTCDDPEPYCITKPPAEALTCENAMDWTATPDWLRPEGIAQRQRGVGL